MPFTSEIKCLVKIHRTIGMVRNTFAPTQRPLDYAKLLFLVVEPGWHWTAVPAYNTILVFDQAPRPTQPSISSVSSHNKYVRQWWSPPGIT